MIAVALLSFFQLQTAQAIPGTGAPQFTVPRASSDPVVDGVLGDSVWSGAARLTGFSQYQPVDGRPADQPTDVLVLYTARALYFGIVAHVRPGVQVNATLSKRDNITSDDRVVIYLDTFNDRRRAFMFGVNPLGVQLDGVLSEGSGAAGQMFGFGEDLNPDFQYQSAGRITDSAYVVEVRIPFKSLRFASSGTQTWGLNIARYTPSANTEDTWVDTKRASASFLVQSGTMSGIANVERGIVGEWQPFVTGTMNGARDAATGEFQREDAKADAGVNLRLGFPAISLDGTINPDFSQVETDVGLVTANERFALFIPEKRPFFLEGIELFSTPNQLVYTRQIVTPAAGAKITGKFGRFGLAHLTALDDRPGPNALFNVSRLRTDFGGNSIGGITFTDRRAGDTVNTVLAADSRLVFAKYYYLETQFGQSWTRHGGGTRSSPLYSAVWDRTGHTWGFHYSLVGFGPEFESDAGFVPRSDNVNLGFFNRLAFWGRTDRSLIQSAWFFGGPNRIWHYDDFLHHAALEGQENLRMMVNLRGGWRVNGIAARSFFGMDPANFRNVSVATVEGDLVPYLPPRKLRNLWSDSMAVSTPVLRTVDASLAVVRAQVPIFAEGSEGTTTRYNLSLGYRPTPSIRVQALASFSHISRVLDGSEYARTFIPRLKLEYQPSRSLFFRVVSELRDERTAALLAAGTTMSPLYVNGAPSLATHTRNLRTDWLISFEPTPGTVAFFGYGSTLERPETPGLDRLRRAQDGFFVKLAYQFRS
jgi:Domain of unknown function (DUF5916)/Carbohydrate family 9 binding domain-like